MMPKQTTAKRSFLKRRTASAQRLRPLISLAGAIPELPVAAVMVATFPVVPPVVI
jgi:hypothetical protein